MVCFRPTLVQRGGGLQVNSDLRASLIAMGAAAGLSALIGLIAGVSFAALLLRALLSGIVFGGLCYGGILLLKRFVPDLFQSEDADTSAGIAAPGSALNIVLPEEQPEAQTEASSDRSRTPSRAESSPSGSAADMPPLEPFSAPETPVLTESSSGEPVEEELSDVSLLGVDETEPEEVQSLDDKDQGTKKAASTVKSAPATAPAAHAAADDGLDDLDVLPDLDSLSDSYASPAPGMEDEAGSPDPAPLPSSSGSLSSSSGSGGSDPAVLAQAVRTMLKHDQKG